MFESSHPFRFFDYFRVPYRVVPSDRGRGGTAMADSDPWGCIRRGFEDGRSPGLLAWPHVLDSAARSRSLTWGEYRLEGIPIFGHVLTDAKVPRWLASGRRWRPTEPVTNETGERMASLWRDADGNLLLPFDPGEVLEGYWSERYRLACCSPVKARLRSAARNAYYLVRPALPHAVQIGIRRALAGVQRAPAFPRWPMETAQLELCDWLFSEVTRFAGRPVPWLAPWPDGYDWAILLTHDVETLEGCRNIPQLREVEQEYGYGSSWNFVPLKYEVSDRVIRDLVRDGCEIGVHGLRHDGRDLSSLRKLRASLPVLHRYRERWGAVGFRSPSTLRTWEWVPLLGFEYDSSYPDTDPYEPQPGGSCSLLPYLNGRTVELPITMPQDHTLFVILRQRDERVWIEKAREIRAWGGMALLLVHPDYVGDSRVIEGYRRLLRVFRDDPTAWHALPRDASDWWRRRAASHLENIEGGWVIRGPGADDARIRLARPGESALRPPSSVPRSPLVAGAEGER